jgi:hypothetical protein
MSSQLKFLRRVRIHGRECGAVARALHHEVKGSSLYQADFEKSSESTNERKQMSTKTTLKRIALVAVSAMGFGLMSSVAPASAAAIAPTAITVGTIPGGAQVGAATTVPVTVSAPYTAAGSDTFSIMVRVTSAPAGSAFQGTSNLGLTSAGAVCTNVSTCGFNTGVYARSGSTTVAATATISLPATSTDTLASATRVSDAMTIGYAFTSAGGATAPTTKSFNVNVTPDVAGSYTVLVSTVNSATPAAYTGATGEVGTYYTFSTGSSVSTMTLSAVTGGSGTSASVGQLVKLTLKDSTGAVASLKSGETVSITAGGTTDKLQKVSVSSGVFTATTSNSTTANTTLVLSGSDFVNGIAYFNYADTTASTGNVITATGSGLLSAAITSTLNTTVTSNTTGNAFAGSAITLGNPTGATRPGSGKVGVTAGTPATDTTSTGSTSHSYTVTVADLTATSYFDVQVTDTAGDLTGIVGQVFNQVLTVTYDATATSQTGTLTLSGALSTAGDAVTALIRSSGGYGATASDGITVTSADAVATSFRPFYNTSTLGSTFTIFSPVGGTNTVWATLRDQFGAAMASKAGTWSVSGRNATATSTAFTTDASGRVSVSIADAGTSATSNTQDTLTITSTVSATITLNYGATTPSTITCLSGNEDDTANLKTYRDISASGTGAQAGAASLCTVTVKDANGAVIVGYPVTTTTASDGAAVLSTSATLYTGSAGTVSPSVYGWTSGTKTFTITAGSVSKTVTVNYEQRTPAEVRTIEASLSGNVLTLTAKDRFGNLVPGVRVYATRTGNATFGGGSTVANAITSGNTTGTTPVPSDNGTTQIIVNAGTLASTVKVQLASAADTPDAEFGQSSSTSGKVCASAGCTDTAVTATTTGTIYTAETGVGASLAAAGVNSVTVAVAVGVNEAQVAAEAATDAAAEAIDAANAATDAANLAAEAADAATVAAEEARDAADAATAAVEELATQVATLMAALKAQITTLANTVAKIAKKVKA